MIPPACPRDGSALVLDREHVVEAARSVGLLRVPADDLCVRVLDGSLVLPIPILFRCVAAGHTHVENPVTLTGRVVYRPICDVCEQPVSRNRGEHARYHNECRAAVRRNPSLCRGKVRYVEVPTQRSHAYARYAPGRG